MTKKTIAKLMIKCYDFTTEKQFTDLINFLMVCFWHCNDNEKAGIIQNSIWYISDKRKYFIENN
jgi:hypothetical protein